jgi:PAS domain S-box-containing protein
MAITPTHVLLIEDNPAWALLIREAFSRLRDAPLTLESAERLSDGLERLAGGRIDLVLLDLMLPDSEGLSTVLQVRQHAPHVPVVVLSGIDDEALAVQALQEGVQDYLVKGQITSNALLRSLRYALERSRRHHAEECLRASREEFRIAQGQLHEQIRQQDRALSATTAFLHNILESSTEYSIIATNLEGIILTWNEGARRTFGYTSEEMVDAQSILLLHTPEDLQAGKVEAVRQQALQTGKAEGVFTGVRRNGQRFPASTVITLRRDAEGAPVGFVRIARDITNQVALEEQLRRRNEELQAQNRRVQEANRLKSEFLANMSHELRTPLNSIIGFAELMHDGKVGSVSAEHKEYLGDILTSARHLHDLINDVLDLAKIESGTLEVRPEPVDPARLVVEMRDLLRALAARKRIRVQTQIDAGVGRVVVDAAKFKQVLYNYLSNALKFTPDEGRVTVRVGPDGAGHFRVEVEDTGIGIRAEDFGKLFVEFQQLDAGAGKKYPGTGLGLALTKRLVEAQGGRVGVRSTPGQGSVFFAVLPRTVSAAPEVSMPPAPAVCPRDGAPTVLVIEDEAEERVWLTAALTQAGYHVQTAATGAEALDWCRRRAFDAITLDLLLPDMNGRDVLQAIQGRGPNADVPVIVLTVIAEKGTAAGFQIHDFLVKPVQPEELLASLRRAAVPPDGVKKVLVVDDDPHALKLMELTLTHLGYRPITRADGASGLGAVEEEQPAAVILDLLMPLMDGFAFLDRLRQTVRGRCTPVIVWTGKRLTEEDRTRLRAAAQGVVLKGKRGIAPLLEELRRHLGTGIRSQGSGGSC